MNDPVSKNVTVSIIVPVYNEEGNVEPLYGQLHRTLSTLGMPYEIIFIDDGSTDATYDRLMAIEDPAISIVRFQRNFGKAAALSCGFGRARGKYVITMDGDLQDDPKEIPRFIEALKTYDVVSGWKAKRNDPLTKLIPSRIFNFLTRALTGVQIHDFNCGYKGYRYYALKNISLYGEMHRYIPAIAYLKGFSVGEIVVEHHPRASGRSKYGAKRLISGMLDLITIRFLMSYSQRPMHIFGLLGMALSSLGMLICLYIFYIWIHGSRIGDRPIVDLGVLLVVIGIQFIATGLIGELLISTRNNSDWVIRKE